MKKRALVTGILVCILFSYCFIDHVYADPEPSPAKETQEISSEQGSAFEEELTSGPSAPEEQLPSEEQTPQTEENTVSEEAGADEEAAADERNTEEVLSEQREFSTSFRSEAMNSSAPIHIDGYTCYVTILEDGTLRLDSCVGKNPDIVFPEEYGGRTFSEIADGAFRNNTNLQSVRLPASIKKIGDFAFYGCSILSSVNLPKGLESIGKSSFQLTRLLMAVIPEGITEIPESAFSQTSLLIVEFPSTLKRIDDNAFAATRIRNIVIPSSVETIGSNVFNATDLLTIEVEEGNLSYKTIDGMLTDINGTELIKTPVSIQTCRVPDSVRHIRNGAFSRNLQTIFIPSTVTEMDRLSISGCTNLKEIFFGGTKEEWAALTAYDPEDTAIKNARVCFSVNPEETLTGVNVNPGLDFSLLSDPDPTVRFTDNGVFQELDIEAVPASASDQMSITSTNPSVVSVSGTTMRSEHYGTCRVEIRNAQKILIYSLKVQVDSPLSLTVEGGTGTGNYRAEEIVSVSADPPEEGKRFVGWKAWNGNHVSTSLPLYGGYRLSDPEIEIVMPKEDLVLQPVYKDMEDNAEFTDRIDYSGTNSESAGLNTSFLTVTQDGGYMRLQYSYYQREDPSLMAEYFDESFHFLKGKIIPLDLPIFGGFYESEDAYYIVTGQNNPYELSAVDCYRITRYDKEWNWVDSVGAMDCNTTIPFRAGSCRMTMMNGELLVHTSHQMYKSSDGLNHQANLSMQIQTDPMRITKIKSSVSNPVTGYVSHSFNQFIRSDGENMVTLDHGDAYPRSAVLMIYNGDFAAVKRPKPVYLLSFIGETGDNMTHASLGGLEVSSSSYLAVGASTDQSSYDLKTRNAFLSVTDKETLEPNLLWLTDYAEGESGVSNTAIVPTGEDTFLVLWSSGGTSYSEGTVYYQKTDGEGNRIGEIHSIAGNLSDCTPVKNGDSVVWYVYNGMAVRFYSIDLKLLSCDIQDIYVPVKRISIAKHNTDLYMHNKDGQFSAEVHPGNATNTGISWSSSDPTVATIDETGKYTLLKPGKTTFTATSKSKENISQSIDITVYEELESSGVTVRSDAVYDGTEHEPEVTVTGSTGETLKEGVDYLVSVPEKVKGGFYTLTVTGIGYYEGTVKKSYRISGRSFSNATITTEEETIYTGEPITPKFRIISDLGEELTEGVDYIILKYYRNTAVGTASATLYGMGNYDGSISATFQIRKRNINDVIFEDIPDQYYSGSSVQPSVSGTFHDKELEYAKDFFVFYTNNINAGEAELTINGRGNFTGQKKLHFRILPRETEELQFRFRQDIYYTGEALEPEFEIWDDGLQRVLEKDQDYRILSWDHNVKAGTANVTVAFMGNYAASSRRAEFQILPSPLINGLYNVDGVWKYYENGCFTEATGIVLRPDNKKWYYVENGVYKKATGLAQQIDNKKWYYVENGVYKKATGLAQRLDNKIWYYVENGAYKKATGLAQRLDNKKWYYIENGQYKPSTGLAKRLDNGKWYYIEKGTFKKKTGAAKRIDNGKWYYVENGVYKKETGLAKLMNADRWYFFYKGVFDRTYSGTAKKIGGDETNYIVERGQMVGGQ